MLLAKGYRIGVAARREDRLQAIRQEAPDRVETAVIDVTADDGRLLCSGQFTIMPLDMKIEL